MEKNVESESGLKKHIKGVLKSFKKTTIEPCTVAFYIVYSLQANVVPDIALSKITKRNDHLNGTMNETFFKVMNTNEAGDWSKYQMIISTAPAAVVVMFLGSWSDRYSRKIPLLLPMIGLLINSILLTMDDWCFHWSPEQLLFTFIPLGLSGNSMMFLMCLSCYVAQTSNHKTRTIRMAVMELALGAGTGIGQFALGRLYETCGQKWVFLTASVILLTGIIYVLLEVDEIRGPGCLKPNPTRWERIVDHIHPGSFWLCLKVCIIRKTTREALMVMTLVIALAHWYLMFGGESTMAYYIIHLVFNMDAAEFGVLQGYQTAANVVGLLFVIPLFMKVFKVRDELLGIISFINISMRPLLVALTRQSYQWLLYVAYTSGVFQVALGSVIRSQLSKIVAAEELGKVYAVTAVFDAAAPPLAAYVYPALFSLTSLYFPTACFLLSTAILLNGSLLLGFVWFLNRRPPVELVAEESEVEKNVHDNPVFHASL